MTPASLRLPLAQRFEGQISIFLQSTLAFVTALIIAAGVMIISGISLSTVGLALVSLATGSFGSMQAVSETLVAAAPLILAGYGFVIAFKAGLFNVGLEGQLLIGGTAGLAAGAMLHGLPLAVHLPIALACAFAGGALWGTISGALKVYSGAHEVITTIMLNFIALRFVDYLLRNPPIQNPGRTDPVSRTVLESAALPKLLAWIDPSLRIDFSIVLALLGTVFIAWFVGRSVLGFEIRITGTNQQAARVAGVNVGKVIVLAMVISGGLAGLAGATLTLGVLGRATPDFTGGLGFEAIAVALLGRLHPLGVLFSGILFGALVAGGRHMQAVAGVSIDLIGIIQAVVLVCIAAPMLIQTFYPFLFRKGKAN